MLHVATTQTKRGCIVEFREYQHIERYGNDEVQGIEFGECYIFPKIDGTNGSVWLNGHELCGGSRRRKLSLDNDNAGFFKAIMENEAVREFLDVFPTQRLYGEWLVPHSFKKYREDAWRKFYIFDVYDDAKEKYLPYLEYEDKLKQFGIDYIPAMTVTKNATYDGLLKALQENVFLVLDGEGCGEGIVIKNYDYQNRFGRTTWAKLITNAFKEKHIREMGPNNSASKSMVEQEIVDAYVTKHFVDKVYAKIVNEMEGWNSKYIPRLLQTVYYDLINEECWDFVKKMKNPTINFKTLNIITTMKIKQLLPELF